MINFKSASSEYNSLYLEYNELLTKYELLQLDNKRLADRKIVTLKREQSPPSNKKSAAIAKADKKLTLKNTVE